jgi:hypothetical protein
MAFGILRPSLVVSSILVPALTALVAQRAWWPRWSARRPRDRTGQAGAARCARVHAARRSLGSVHDLPPGSRRTCRLADRVFAAGRPGDALTAIGLRCTSGDARRAGRCGFSNGERNAAFFSCTHPLLAPR